MRATEVDAGLVAHRPRGAMLDELRGNDWMSRGDRREQRRIDTTVHKLEQRFFRAPCDSEIALEMSLSLQDYQSLSGRVSGVNLVYLEDMSGDDGDDDYLDRFVAEGLGGDPQQAMEDAQTKDGLASDIEWAMTKLTERERSTWSMRWIDGMSTSEICVALQLNASNVLVTQGVALVKMSQLIRNRPPPLRNPTPLVKVAAGHEDAEHEDAVYIGLDVKVAAMAAAINEAKAKAAVTVANAAEAAWVAANIKGQRCTWT